MWFLQQVAPWEVRCVAHTATVTFAVRTTAKNGLCHKSIFAGALIGRCSSRIAPNVRSSVEQRLAGAPSWSLLKHFSP